MCDIPDYVQVILDRIVSENGFENYTIDIKQGSQIGDGFLSELSSIRITEKDGDKNLALMCKIAPLSEARRKEFFSKVVFDREATFYTKLMPAYAKFQQEKNVPHDDQFLAYAKCYAAVCDDSTEQYAIVMEDLHPKDFKMWNKARPARIENLSVVMREIGKFHGISMAMKDQRPMEFATFQQLHDLSSKIFESSKMQAMFNASFDRAIEVLRKPEHQAIMNSFKDNTLSHFHSCLNGRFDIVAHGDIWNNNILFRFNNNEIAEDIKFVDWQMCRYVSPAIDLLGYIFTCTDKALRTREFKHLLETYHKSLSRTINLLGSNADKLFTMDDLTAEMELCGKYALLLGPVLIPISLADSSQITNLDEMCEKTVENDEFITDLNDAAQSEYGQRLSDVIDDIIALGYYRPNQ